MKHSQEEMTLPDIALVAITRVALGTGIGLLLSQRLSAARRAAAGWALMLVGIVTTVPLAIEAVAARSNRRGR